MLDSCVDFSIDSGIILSECPECPECYFKQHIRFEQEYQDARSFLDIFSGRKMCRFSGNYETLVCVCLSVCGLNGWMCI